MGPTATACARGSCWDQQVPSGGSAHVLTCVADWEKGHRLGAAVFLRPPVQCLLASQFLRPLSHIEHTPHIRHYGDKGQNCPLEAWGK